MDGKEKKNLKLGELRPDPDGRVVIPEGVTELEPMAFALQGFLTQVDFPQSLRKIGEKAFVCCTELTHLEFPHGLREIGPDAFQCCFRLTEVHIPASVEKIGRDAFGSCGRLIRVQHPEESEATEEAVEGDTALTIHAPAGSYAQRWAEKHGIPFEAEEEKENRPCLTALEPEEDHVLVIPEGVLEVEEMAFAERTDLTGVVFPNSLRKIGRGAFYGCMGLTQVSLPQGVTQVGGLRLCRLYRADRRDPAGESAGAGQRGLCQLHQPYPHRPAGGTGAAGRLCLPGLRRPAGSYPAGRAAGDPGGDLFGLRFPPAVPPSGAPAGHRQAGF